MSSDQISYKTFSTAPTDKVERNAFRVSEAPPGTPATVKIGGRKLPVKLVDRSTQGFAILVAKKHARSLRVGANWILDSDDEKSEVMAQWLYHAPDGQVQVGLRRLRDLTPPPKASWLPSWSIDKRITSNPEILACGLVIAIFLALALPGIGDSLGTSNRILDGFEALCEVVRDSVRAIW